MLNYITKELEDIEEKMTQFLLDTGRKKSNKKEFELYMQIVKTRKNIYTYLRTINSGKDVRILCNNELINKS